MMEVDNTDKDNVPADPSDAIHKSDNQLPAEDTSGDIVPEDPSDATLKPDNQLPAEDSSVDSVPADPSDATLKPDNQLPAEDSSVDSVPADPSDATLKPDNQLPAEDSSGDNVPADLSDATLKPDNQLPAEDSSGDNVPADLSDATPKPDNQLPAVDSAGDNVPADPSDVTLKPDNQLPAENTSHDKDNPPADTSDNARKHDNNPVKNKRNYTRKNFDQAGRIIISAREGRERSDTYLKRSGTILKNCTAIHTLTKCHVQVNIIPTWKGGKERLYKSPGYPAANNNNNIKQEQVTVSVSSSTDPVSPQKSPKKRISPNPDQASQNPTQKAASSQGSQPQAKKTKKTSRRSDVCAICDVEFDSPADEEIPAYWLNCQYHEYKAVKKGSKSKNKAKGGRQPKECPYWVHTTCAGIYYPQTRAGRMQLDRWSPSHFFCPDHMPKVE